MILRPTLLILGAGASNPYGYPLGTSLVQHIVHLTRPGGELSRVFGDEPYLNVFHTRLANSDASSIDDFLESNPKFLRLGKLAIAGGLTVWGPGATAPIPDEKHWYKYLWTRLHEGAASPADFKSNKLTVLTYNYEMSLERYLTRVLANTYPDFAEQGEAAAARFLAEVVPILHIHGTLNGADSEVLHISAESRSRFLDAEFFNRAASGIRIVHEDITQEYRQAHDWLRAAEKVYMLGFGYHATNLRRLDLVTQSQARDGWARLGGTALGLEEAERIRAVNAMQIGMNPALLQPVDCLKYLRATALLE